MEAGSRDPTLPGPGSLHSWGRSCEGPSPEHRRGRTTQFPSLPPRRAHRSPPPPPQLHRHPSPRHGVQVSAAAACGLEAHDTASEPRPGLRRKRGRADAGRSSLGDRLKNRGLEQQRGRHAGTARCPRRGQAGHVRRGELQSRAPSGGCAAARAKARDTRDPVGRGQRRACAERPGEAQASGAAALGPRPGRPISPAADLAALQDGGQRLRLLTRDRRRRRGRPG